MVALAAVALLGGTGCNTLRARKRANEASVLYKKGDYPAAALKYEEAVKADPGIATLHLNLGFTYLSVFTNSPKTKEGQDAGGRALQCFQRYIELKPSDPRGRNYLLQTFVDTKRYDDAVIYFKPEVDRTPPSLEAIQTLGQIASKTGRIDDALQWYQRRVELTPNDPDAHYNLGVLIWDYLYNHLDVQGLKRIQLADTGMASLKRAIELRPHSPDPYTYANLVMRERAKGQIDEEMKKIDEDEATRYMNMALSLKGIKVPGAPAPGTPGAPGAPGATPAPGAAGTTPGAPGGAAPPASTPAPAGTQAPAAGTTPGTTAPNAPATGGTAAPAKTSTAAPAKPATAPAAPTPEKPASTTTPAPSAPAAPATAPAAPAAPAPSSEPAPNAPAQPAAPAGGK